MTESITLPADVRRLVIAARAFIDPDTVARCCLDEQRELFEAGEAFASRVPWENGPDEDEVAAAPDARIKTAIGPTILLRSGAYFDLLDPHNSDFTIEDIAHGLSMTCRFAGQCSHFYSVAEHSWHASFLVPDEFKLRALMHDAAEAFIGDVTRPLKALLPEYKAIERNIEAAVQKRFDTGDWNVEPIKRADLQMLRAEQVALMPRNGDRWPCLDEIEMALLNFRLWSPERAREEFLARYEDLR